MCSWWLNGIEYRGLRLCGSRTRFTDKVLREKIDKEDVSILEEGGDSGTLGEWLQWVSTKGI